MATFLNFVKDWYAIFSRYHQLLVLKMGFLGFPGGIFLMSRLLFKKPKLRIKCAWKVNNL